ncbi:MBL fold metallo-hydrolase [Sporosarcina ureilytica]|uniref:MBL fold metallo-hydrolase n=1 Tax=Sporosarcina ureilytica TaxID=298596 RepID=A0A1D8JFR7_9BACL|nr:MBL fold metallo-hydrolase [Sporosarcina ureilytica]AOV07551.1 MBL fold metallo-hydrolase [Sporosarcina ureilytica]
MLEKLGVIPIQVDLPFRLNHVNCFMAEGENGWTIIDAGLNNKETSRLWEEIIRDKHITDLYITHYHPDHYGHAGALQKKTGARVSMSKIDAENGRKAWTDEFINKIVGWYVASGISLKTAQQMVQNTADFKPLVTPAPTINHHIVEGEKVPFGNYEYEVIVTPGHADGMVCFYNAENQVLFSADHILPRITPNISYWFHGDSNPLKSYLASLEKVKQLNARFVIPSHGKPFYDANKRIEEIEKHHDDRLNETLAALSEKSTVNEIYKRLFQWELTIHETRFAIGETLAHLEYLRSTGDCTRELHDNKWIYMKR